MQGPHLSDITSSDFVVKTCPYLICCWFLTESPHSSACHPYNGMHPSREDYWVSVRAPQPLPEGRGESSHVESSLTSFLFCLHWSCSAECDRLIFSHISDLEIRQWHFISSAIYCSLYACLSNGWSSPHYFSPLHCTAFSGPLCEENSCCMRRKAVRHISWYVYPLALHRCYRIRIVVSWFSHYLNNF